VISSAALIFNFVMLHTFEIQKCSFVFCTPEVCIVSFDIFMVVKIQVEVFWVVMQHSVAVGYK
jgi:hypothetical protein